MVRPSPTSPISSRWSSSIRTIFSAKTRPTSQRVMLKIRRLGAFKPWGAAVSAIEIALWDIAGQVAGVPVYKLLGGKIRDRVRIYNGGVRFPMTGQTPQDYAENMAKMKEAKEGFTLIKQAVGFHDPAMMRAIPNVWYDEPPRKGASHPDRGIMTERGLEHVIACVEAMKKVLGNEIGLALDCGPGWTVKDAITFARALEPLHIAWLEDMITGDYTPYPNAELFREVTQSTSIPIHTGEEIYLRENFKDLIEKQAVNVVGPDPEDVGGIAEMKWIAEYADIHGILSPPTVSSTGLFGLAAHVQMAAALAAKLHRLRVSVGPARVVVRHCRRPAQPDRQTRLHQRVGSAGSRCHLQCPGSQIAPGGRGSPLLRLKRSQKTFNQ